MTAQSSTLVKFLFDGDELDVVPGVEVSVVVRRICDVLGVSYQGQIEKLKADPSTCLKMILTQIPGDDQRREVACVPIRTLPLWLATIHPSKVKPEARDKLIKYKLEAAEVLADHFIGPRQPPVTSAAPTRPLTPRQQEVLSFVQAHARTTGKPPTFQRVATHFGWASTNTAREHLLRLEALGALQLRHTTRAPSITLPSEASPAQPAAPPSHPAAPAAPSTDPRIDQLVGMVEQLVGAVALLVRPLQVQPPPPPPAQPPVQPLRHRLPPAGQGALSFEPESPQPLSTLALRIVHALYQRNMNARALDLELAKRLGKKPSSASGYTHRVLKRGQQPGADTLAAMAEILQVDVGWLLTGRGAP